MAPAPDADRSRRLYVGPWRIDLTRRSGVPRILPGRAIARAAAAALGAAAAPAPGSLAIVLTDDGELAELNAAHMGQRGPTDVLSFPMLPPEVFPRAGRSTSGRGGPTAAGRAAAVEPAPRGPALRGRTHLGDIAISVERAIEQAAAGRGGQTGDVSWSPADELRLLVTHGVLHICGWDHAGSEEEAEMRALERQLLGRPVARDSRRPSPNERQAPRRAGPLPPSTTRASRSG